MNNIDIMKKSTLTKTLNKVVNQLITNITSASVQIIKNSLQQLDDNDQQNQGSSHSIVQQSKVQPNFTTPQQDQQSSLFLNNHQRSISQNHQPNKSRLNSQIESNILPQHKGQTFEPIQLSSKQQSQQAKNVLIHQPPNQPNKAGYLEQESIEKFSKNIQSSVIESKKQARKSSEQSSINLELTQKTKKSRILSQSMARGDSLIYSDATLLNSNGTGFGVEISPARIQKQNKLNKIQDQEAEISARMSNTQSRQYDRIKTQSQVFSDKQSNKFKKIQIQADNNHKIFNTEVNEEKSKIGKIKELKQMKKKKLEAQLHRINEQLDELTKKQQDMFTLPKINNFESRVKISDDIEAKVKAERLVKELRYEKKSLHDAHLGDIQVIDKNINNYMEELMKERYKNEERIKQRKKLEIIERMKHQEMRKIEEQLQKDKNMQFVTQLKNCNSKSHIPIKPTQESNVYKIVQTKQRSPTKKSEPSLESEITPLSRKKAYLQKVRNLSKGRQVQDRYEQVLM